MSGILARSTLPLSIALTAGGLSVVSRCGFPLLPRPHEVVTTGAPIIGGVDTLQDQFVSLLGGS